IGQAVALAFGRAGASVVLAARDRDRLAAVTDAIREAGGKAEWELLDLADSVSTLAIVPSILERRGHLDILVNNAGLRRPEPLLESKVETWDDTITTNLKATWLLSREAARVMIPRKQGR